MSREWTPEEERAMASDPSEWEPIEVDVDPTAGIVFDVGFDRSECAELMQAVGAATRSRSSSRPPSTTPAK